MREKLRRILAERNLSQVDLQRLTAKRFPPRGVSISSIRQIATGRKTGAFCAWQLALALDLPAEYFYEGNRKNGKRTKR